LRSDLDFGTFFLRPDYRCMYRAVAIRLRRRDIILETAGHHRPARVQRPERTIAIRYVVHDHAEPEYVGKLFQRNRAALHLPPHRIGPLLPPDHFARKSAFLQLHSDLVGDLLYRVATLFPEIIETLD